MKLNKHRRWLLALIIIAVVIIVSVGIALSYRDNLGSIPMSAITDGSGGAIIAWHNNEGIYAQRIDSAGEVQWQKGGVLIAKCPPGSGFDLQSDGIGGAIIAWNDRRSIPDDHNDPGYFGPVPFHAQRISSEGDLLWDHTLISAGGNWQVVPDEAGGAIFAWNGYLPYYRALHDDYLRLQKLAPDGTHLWGNEGVLIVSSSPYRPLTEEEIAAGIKGTVNRSRPTYAGTHDIVSGVDSGTILIWEEEGYQSTYQVYAQRLDSGGNPVWRDTVMVGSASYQDNSLISDGLGGAILALTDRDTGATYQQYISANGELLDKKEYAPNTISDGLGGSFRVRVEANPPSGPPSEKSSILYVQRFDDKGSPLWSEKQVLATTKRYQIANLEYIADGKGGIILLWQLQKEFVSYGGTFALKLDAEGNIRWSDDGIAVFNAPAKYQGNAQILSDGSSGALVIAIAGKNALGGDMIYAQYLDTDGRLLWGDGIRIDR